jgi:hypothetical protein
VNIPVIPQDKANHVIYGAAISLAFQWLAVLLHAQLGITPFVGPKQIGAIASTVFGIAKELADRELNLRAVAAGLPPPHSVELKDFLATVAGGLLVALAP